MSASSRQAAARFTTADRMRKILPSTDPPLRPIEIHDGEHGSAAAMVVVEESVAMEILPRDSTFSSTPREKVETTPDLTPTKRDKTQCSVYGNPDGTLPPVPVTSTDPPPAMDALTSLPLQQPSNPQPIQLSRTWKCIVGAAAVAGAMIATLALFYGCLSAIRKKCSPTDPSTPFTDNAQFAEKGSICHDIR
ncbi:hypothetical protein PRIPAC_76297 [Pristionchus pacificus]|uniref:Uncharacterized protein n=1 Tax=Pristionchus pacificus TaxID=54126 RepID=A0A2A6C576_PRIPA|nr:hypothetical protein PRIPAC_76297 [Pristionchus pacificus]|eukprot:PDM73258.1 hypothetical protein PRIPAC_40614 [Pristionchus pacificus]